jgi:hypothetical protein
MTDNHGYVLAPLPVAPVNETDMVLLPKGLKALKQVAKEACLDLRGAYVNLDGGFDSRANRKCIFNAGMIPNIKENPRNRKHPIVSGSIFAWRWSFQMQAVNMRDQFSFRGPATAIEAQHLIRPLGRGSSDPQAEQQTRTKGRIHLDAHPVDPLAQQMPAAQDTFNPAEKQFDVIVTSHKIRMVRPSRVFILPRTIPPRA